MDVQYINRKVDILQFENGVAIDLTNNSHLVKLDNTVDKLNNEIKECEQRISYIQKKVKKYNWLHACKCRRYK